MDLIVFDCDGVLVDSEIIAKRVVAETLASYLPQVDLDAILPLLAGKTNAAVIEQLERDYRAGFPGDMLYRVDKAIDAALDAELEPITGVQTALDTIGLPKAVASNSGLSRIHRSLARAGIADHFGDRVFSRDHVEHPKPAPDLYLLAAREAGAEPGRAIVVEDSESGALAAVRAGMTVIGFLGASHIVQSHRGALEAVGVSHFADDMTMLPQMVAELSRV